MMKQCCHCFGLVLYLLMICFNHIWFDLVVTIKQKNSVKILVFNMVRVLLL